MKKFWNDVTNFFSDNVWNIVKFFAVLLIGILVVKLLINIARRLLKKTKMEKIAQSFFLGILKFVFYFVLVLILLSILKVEITGFITALSAVILAVGMALEANIANFANGLVIISTHLFKKGDFVSVNGVEGSVTNINFFFTTLTTPDNKSVTIPNSAIVNGSVVNCGANPKRRVDFTFSVAYETDVELVKKIVVSVMTSNGNVWLDPAPFCRLKTLNESSIDFFANCWVDKDDYWDVYYYVMENAYNEFKRNGISIPFKQIEVRERKDEVTMPLVEAPLPERVEKERPQKNAHFDLEKDDLIVAMKKCAKSKKNKNKTNN